MPRYFRKVIQIKAEDSPNVRLALAQIEAGLEPTGEVLVPGVLTWDDYKKRRKTWDVKRQAVGLDAEFYEGAEVLLYPPDWLERSARMHRAIKGRRVATGIGVDPAEGGDKTAMAAVDDLGLIELVSEKTPNTDAIIGKLKAFVRRHNCPWDRVVFDRGGGGKQHADRLRNEGLEVRTVSFGESLAPAPHRGVVPLEDRMNQREARTTYLNRRAALFGRLRERMDPEGDTLESTRVTFALPPASAGPQYAELRRQLVLFPLMYDSEGRMRLPPKNKPNPNSKERTLTEIMGCSPDESDALVVAVYASEDEAGVITAGAY